jgi:hypothetical protein
MAAKREPPAKEAQKALAQVQHLLHATIVAGESP